MFFAKVGILCSLPATAEGSRILTISDNHPALTFGKLLKRRVMPLIILAHSVVSKIHDRAHDLSANLALRSRALAALSWSQ